MAKKKKTANIKPMKKAKKKFAPKKKKKEKGTPQQQQLCSEIEQQIGLFSQNRDDLRIMLSRWNDIADSLDAGIESLEDAKRNIEDAIDEFSTLV